MCGPSDPPDPPDPPGLFEFLARLDFRAPVGDALGDFGEERGAFGDGILHLDGGLEFEFFLLHHEKDFFDGRVTLAEGHVGSVVGLAILDMDVGDALVVGLDPLRGRRAGGGEEVPDIDVGAVVLGIGEGLFPCAETAGFPRWKMILTLFSGETPNIAVTSSAWCS